MSAEPDDFDPIAHNRAVHDSIADTYDQCHEEIYNPTEQSRLGTMLKRVIGLVESGTRPPRVLDFGAGTGNVSRHLLDLGAEVVAADVSPQSLAQLQRKLGPTNGLETFVLNGENLSGMAGESFDMVVTYSVLHHVPDYLGAVQEMLRVIRPGGVLCIDHEVCPAFWSTDGEYLSYLADLDQEQHEAHLNRLGVDTRPMFLGMRIPNRLIKAFSFRAWRRLLARKFGASQHHADEGDIHVTLADHIDWEAIESLLSPHCSETVCNDYLVCREKEVPPVCWSRWFDRCADMRMLVARKK